MPYKSFRPTAPFNVATMATLEGAAKSLAARMLETMRLELTPEEFISAYIEPQHVGPLHAVQEVCGFIGQVNSNIYAGADVVARVWFAGMPPIILPGYIPRRFSPAAPPELVEKIQAFACERLELGKKFSNAVDALYWLNGNCGDIGSFRVMFPALPTLFASMDDDPKSATSKRAVRLSTMRKYGAIPPIGLEELAVLREASALLQAASMLPRTDETDSQVQRMDKGTAVISVVGCTGDRLNVFTNVVGNHTL